jgi:uncharacterized protein (TIGR02231 family)
MRQALGFGALALAPLFALPLAAQAPAGIAGITGIAAPIQRVRLHPDEAWVTRVGRAKVQSAGISKFLVSDLPPGLGVHDIRIGAKGPAGTRLGDISVGTEARKVIETPEYAALKKERGAMQDGIDAIEANVEALKHEARFLSDFGAVYNKDVSARLVSGAPSGASVVEMSESLSRRLAAVLTKVRMQGRELAELAGEIRRLDARMLQMASMRSASPSRAVVEISSQRPGDVEIEISYRTRLARWTPAYEARLGADDGGLELALFASVVQTSGEDWVGAKLEITNARASRSLVTPVLPGPQVVTWTEAPAAFDAAPRIAYSKVYAVGDAGLTQNTYVQPNEGMAAQDAGLDEMDETDATMEMGGAAALEASSVEEIKGLSTTWSLEGAKDVPSDGEPHRFRVTSAEIEPTMALVAVPRIDPTAYRVARFPIPSGIPLFPNAPVVHFAGTQRVGESPLLVPGAGRPMQLGFGPYRGVRVALARLDAKKESVGTFTKDTQWTIAERFDASNDLGERVTLEIQDRELRAGSDRVKVSFQPERPPADGAQTPGVLRWTFDLQPKATASMPFTYQIRVPQGAGRASGLEGLNLPGH